MDTIIKENFALNLVNFKYHKSNTILNDIIKYTYLSGEDSVFVFSVPVTVEISTALDDVLLLNDVSAPTPEEQLLANDLRISSLVEPALIEAPFNVVDFKRHLLPPYTLNKVVTKNPDGRPNMSEYFWNGEKMAQIIFVFRNFPDSPLMMKRAEILNYVKKDGTFAPDIYIKSKVFDLQNPVDLQTLVAEREDARRNIINGMMGTISGIMVQSGYATSSADASLKARAFFDLVEGDKNAFISIGTEDFKEFLLGIDLSQPEYDYTQGGIYGWLSLPLPAPLGSVRNYMSGALTYVTSDTHIDKVI